MPLYIKKYLKISPEKNSICNGQEAFTADGAKYPPNYATDSMHVSF